MSPLRARHGFSNNAILYPHSRSKLRLVRLHRTMYVIPPPLIMTASDLRFRPHHPSLHGSPCLRCSLQLARRPLQDQMALHLRPLRRRLHPLHRRHRLQQQNGTTRAHHLCVRHHLRLLPARQDLGVRRHSPACCKESHRDCAHQFDWQCIVDLLHLVVAEEGRAKIYPWLCDDDELAGGVVYLDVRVSVFLQEVSY